MSKKSRYYLGFPKGEPKVKSGLRFPAFSHKWPSLSFPAVNNDGGSPGGNGLAAINNVIKKFFSLL